jgi:predicted MFS family arabinose efflux permease
MIFLRSIQLYRNSFEGLSKNIWLLAAVMLINRSGTMVIPFLSLYLTAELGFSKSSAAWVSTAFGLGSLLGAFLGGKLSDKIGFFKVQFGSLFLSAFFFTSLIWFKDLFAISVMIFLTSVVSEAFRPANFAAVAAYSDVATRTRAVALIRMAINLGIAIGPGVGGLIAVKLGFTYLFLIDGVTCLFAAIFLKLNLTPPKIIPTSDKPSEMPVSGYQSPYRDTRYMVFILLVIINAVAFFQILNAEPLYFREICLLNEGQIGLLMAVNGLIIAATEMPLIYILEKWLSKLQIIIIGTLLIGFSFWMFNWTTPSWNVALISMIIITIGEMMSLPFLSTLALNRANDSNRGQYMAVFTMGYSVSHIISSNFGMRVADVYGFNTLWNLIGIICVIACLGFFLLEKTRKT